MILTNTIAQFMRNTVIIGGNTGIVWTFYKGRSTLVPVVPKITARWRQMNICIFCAKSRQNERSSVVCSLNVNKLSRIFS